MKNNYKHVSIEIENDSDTGNPRDEFDNLGTIYAVKNSRYLSGGKNDIEYTYRDSLDEMIRDLRKAGAVIVEFSGNSGDCYMAVERNEVIKEYGDASRSSLYRARQCAKAEVETWLAWCEGEVYGYKIVNDETGETLDSCWGFYGLSYCEQEASERAKFYDNQIEHNNQLIESRLANVAQ